MATYSNSGPTPEPLSHEPRGKLVEYEQFIEDQLRKTRSHVRSVDIAGSLMLLAAATLGYLLLAALVDHWMVPGGLGFWGRMLFFVAYLGGAGYFLATQVLPLLVRRINPVYAAHTIERSGPTLKNSLINFLLFRENPTGVNNVVYEAIEEQAATRLAKVHVESAVDRTKLIRIGYALLGILLVCALYTLISPKNLLQTVGRVAMPWADIAPPTRTTIAEIEPGNAEAFRGQQVTVKARVQGLRDAAPVTLYYTTADRQIVDRAVEMQLPTDGYKHEIILPAGDSSLQQSLTYRIEAGDAISKTYTIEVVAAPTIVVQSVEYKYPSYTGLLPQRIEHQGDLKAIEGTEVTLHALANQEIDSAHIDFNCDNKLNTRMRSEGTQASVSFRLLLKEDRQTPEHDCYQVIFKNPQGQQNPKPVRHQIEVTRDLAPEIQFVAPQRDEIDLPANGQVELELVAADPDFALRRVQLAAQVAGQSVLETNLLDSAWRGQWVHKYRFEPAKLKLKSGDVVEYWAVAEDNKDPEPNRTQTARRRIRIVSPSDNGQQDQLAQNDPQNQGQGQPGEGGQPGDNAQARDDQAPRDPNDQQNQKPQEDPQQGEPGGDRQSGGGQQQRQDQQAQDGQQQQEQPAEQGQGEQGQGEQGQGEQQPGQGQQQPGEQGGGGDAADERPSSVPNDGTNDGDAIERILEHRNQQQKSDPSQQEKQQQGNQPQQGERQQDKQQQPDQGGERREQQQNQKQPGQESEEQREQGDGQQSGDQQGQQGNAQRQPGAPERQQSGDQQQQKPGGDQQQQQRQPGDQQQPKQGDQQQQRGQENQAQDKQGQGNQGQEKQPQQPQGGEQGKGKSGQQKSGEQGQGGGEQQGEGKDRAQGQGEATDEQPDENTPVEDAAPGDRPPQGKGRPTDRQPSGQKPQAGDQAPDSDAQGKPQPGEKSDAEGDKSRKQGDPSATRDGQEKPGQPGDETATDRQQGQRDDKQPQGAEKPGQSGDSDASDAKDARDTQGQGAQSKSDPTRDPSKSGDKPQGEQRPDARGGDGEQEKGKSGAGQGSKEDAGSPTPQEQAQPRDKTSRPKADNEEQPPEGPEQSPSTSKRESDSEGGDDGDRSGGGKRGGGQKADKPGTGGAGENTAADQGAGQSEQSGDGEAADRAGDKRASDNAAGKPGSEKGDGTERRPAEGQDAQPGEGGEPQPDQPGGKDGQPAQGQPGGDQSGSQAQTPSGGKPGDSRPAEQQWKPGQDAADEANLDYARKSTDLALEHLKDQLKRDEPDQALLDKLGWTRDDLQNFVRRWEKMRGSAQASGEKGAEGKRELDETLRSLGLKPRATSIKSAGQSDRVQGLRESRRTSPPPEYAEQYKAYTQGTARGK